MTSMKTGGIERPRPQHIAALLCVGLFMGSAYLAIKISLQGGLGPLTITALRLVIAAAVVMPFVAFRSDGHFPRGFNRVVMAIFVAILNTSLPYFLVAWSAQRLDSGFLAIVLATGPLMGLIASHFLSDDDRFSWMKAASIAIGFTGVLVSMSASHYGYTARTLIGVAGGLGAALSFTLGGVLARRLDELPADIQTLCVLTLGAATMLPVSIAIEGVPNLLAVPNQSLLALLYLGAAATGLTYLLRFRLINSVGYTFASYTGYLIPAVGVVLGALYLDESVGLIMLLGLLLTLGGAWLRRWC